MPDPIRIPYAGGTLIVYNTDFLDPLGSAQANALEEAAAQGFNVLSGSLSRDFRGASRAIFEQLQRPLQDFTSAAGLLPPTLRLLPTGSVPPAAFDPLAFIRDVFFASPDPVFQGAGVFDVLRKAETNRFLASQQQSGDRNPFHSLQAGPFVPCSVDDPKGRCLTPGARRLARNFAARAAGR